jgi:hypothetical protein
MDTNKKKLKDRKSYATYGSQKRKGPEERAMICKKEKTIRFCSYHFSIFVAVPI